MLGRTWNWQLPDRVVSLGGRPLVMGIVNVTPDSFSDGGLHPDPEAAIAHGLRLVAQGADILDIGGESTRPGATPVPADEELRRVLPVVASLAKQTETLLSIDTSKAVVASACLDAGAQIVNDVTGLGDSGMAEVVRRQRAGLILMHMQGTPPTMQLQPHYADLIGEIHGYLESRLQHCRNLGIGLEQIALDPGVGFGKTHDHNLELVARLEEFLDLGRPICLGVSRKGFIGKVLGRPLGERMLGSVITAVYAASRGAAQIVRVHDVAETREAMSMLAAITRFAKASLGQGGG